MIGRKRLLRATALLLLITAILVGLWQGRSLDMAAIVQRIGELAPLAWLAFMALYAVAWGSGSILHQCRHSTQRSQSRAPATRGRNNPDCPWAPLRYPPESRHSVLDPPRYRNPVQNRVR